MEESPGRVVTGRPSMEARIASMDWSQTELGPLDGWPQSLKTVVGTCIRSRFPMAVCWGENYLILYNDGYSQILGSKHPWALGRPCFEVWGELAHIVRPMFDSVLATGIATWSDDLMLPMHRHGYLEEAYFTVSYSAIQGEGDLPAGILVTVTETTERFLAQRRLKLVRRLGSAASQTRSLASAIERVEESLSKHPEDIPFFLLYRLGENKAKILTAGGFDRSTPDAAHFLASHEVNKAPWPFQELMASGGPIETALPAEHPFRGNEEAGPPTAAILLPIVPPSHPAFSAVLVAGINPRRALDDHHRQFFSLVCHQISTVFANALAHEEAEQKAEALAEIDRAKTVFFSNVSHEFRTPLTLLLGALEAVLQKDKSGEDRENLELANRNAHRLLKLVNALLDFSRIEAGRIQASYQPTEIGGFTANIASGFQSIVESAGMDLVVNCPAQPEPAYVDREMWEKMVLNLLSNAFKFTFDGSISISLTGDGRNFHLSVADTGIGIPEEELPNLFERFHRVKGAQGRSFEGSGIGLALVFELAKLHGGSVEAESHVGKGSQFTIHIPAGSEHLPKDRVHAATELVPQAGNPLQLFAEESSRWLSLPASSQEEVIVTASPAAAGSHTKTRILIVDDNADMRDYLERLLGHLYSVALAGDGLAALESIEKSAPHLVVADVMMPRLSGLELVRKLRERPSTQHIPVILLSARAGEDARVEGLGAGADDYLEKPFSARELLTRVASRLELAALRRTLSAERALIGRALGETPIPIAVIEGQELTFTMANPAYLEVVGKRDIVSKPLLQALPELTGQGLEDLLLGVMRTGEAFIGREMLVRIQRKPDLGIEDTYWTFIYAPFGPDRVLVICSDTTDEVRVRQELERLTAKLTSELVQRERAEAALDAQKGAMELVMAGVPLASVLDYLATTVDRITAGTSSILLLSGDGRLYNGSSPCVPADYLQAIDGVRIGPGVGCCGAAAARNTVVISADIASDPNWREFRDFALKAGFRAAWSQPIIDTHSHVLGTFAVYYAEPRRPTPEELEVVELLSHTAGLVIERSRADQRLMESEARFRNMADHAPVMIWITDADDRCTYLSKSWYEFTGQTENEGLGIGWLEAVHPDDREESGRVFRDASEKRESFRLEYRLRKADGEYTWAIDAASPRLDPKGMFLGYIGSVIEISERKEMEEELRRANADLEMFAHSVSHDLQEPLRAIRTFSELLQKKTSTKLDETERHLLDRVSAGAGRMSDMIRDLLAYSRIGKTGGEVATSAADAYQKALDNLSASIEETQAAITADALPQLGLDPASLQQLFQNLLGNAIKYRRPGVTPRIHVSATRTHEHWLLKVTDNGIGIPEEQRTKVFDLFYRLHGNKYSGTGIGLTACRRIVERYGGKIWIDSSEAGTAFCFTLPAVGKFSTATRETHV